MTSTATAATSSRRWIRAILLVVLVLTPIAALASPASAAPAAASGPAAQMLALVNGERAAAGLPALEWRDDVAGIAQQWSETMAATGIFGHNDAYFSDATRQLLGSATRGENVSNAGSVQSSHTNLMNSPPHRANILSAEYTQIGIGVVTDAVGRVWVTQGFMRPSGAAPAAPAPAPEPEPAPEPAPAPAPPVEVAAPAPAPTAPPAPTTLPPTTVPPAPETTVPPTTVAPTTTVTTDAAVVAGPAQPADPGDGSKPLAQQAVAFGAVAVLGLAHARRASALRRAEGGDDVVPVDLGLAAAV